MGVDAEGFLLTLVVLTLNLVYAGQTRAQDRARVGWAAMTASHTPLWVTQDKGFLAKQGLSIEPIFFSAAPPAMQALVAGDLDIVVTSAPKWSIPPRRRGHGDDPVDHSDFYRSHYQRA